MLLPHSKRPRRVRVAGAVVASVATAVALSIVSVTPAFATSAADHQEIAHTKPTWLGDAHRYGSAADSQAVNARVYLAPKGGVDAVKAAAIAVSTPGSASYRHYVSAAQYQRKYGVPAASVASVSTYLRSVGLAVTGVAAKNRYIAVRGTVAAAEKAFGTQIDRYRHDGHDVQAPTSALSVPATIASSVLTVSGLDTTPSKMTPTTTPQDDPPAGFRNARPCSAYYGQLLATHEADGTTPLPAFDGKALPYAVCGYTGAQLRSAYSGGSGLTGAGVTVGIVDAYAAPTIASDAQTYAKRNGGVSYKRGQLKQTTLQPFTDAADCGPSGWYGEETLDVEAVHAMAPKANIHYYGAASCNDSDFVNAIAKVVDDDAVQVVSNSYGEPESDDASELPDTLIFAQGALEGISFLFSSGDDGDELANTGTLQADSSATNPFVTAVGGTATEINKKGKLTGQTGWGTDKFSLSADSTTWSPVGYLYGSGGGSSAIYAKPPYQYGVTPGTTRQVPDVAMDADPTTGMLVGETQTFSDGVYYDQYRIGGTSLASPLFAGMTALSLQKVRHHRAGLLNPVIYKKRSAFTDVSGPLQDEGNVRVDYANGENATDGLLYSVRTFDQDSSLTVTPGWDDVTGVGVPNHNWFKALR